jgi:predicted nucleic acid-binding Zn ribbon protein
MREDAGASGAARASGTSGGSDAPVGADLARQILAQTKRAARERATRSRRPGPSAGRPAEFAGDGADRATASEEAGGSGDSGGSGSAGGSGGSGDSGGAAGSGGSGGAAQAGRRRRLPGIAPLGREWRQPVGFAAAMRGLVDERGWRDRAKDATVLARWDTLVGSEIAARCSPVSLRDGELVVVAESTAWATQLRLLSGQILARLRAELGPEVARSLTIRGPSTPTWNHGPLRAPGGRGPRDTYG